ncbi:unnamed protein product [Trichogramma brassicae]|uniref:Endonuclease/exonuclease/phosphatase domain-containing protein n=1 Tax=Trichogramma brassicae TaxID=86971 RepID=A0A6H5J3E4_9HYME|nr:unnamed protein product [Trichogramma brassicae]
MLAHFLRERQVETRYHRAAWSTEAWRVLVKRSVVHQAITAQGVPVPVNALGVLVSAVSARSCGCSQPMHPLYPNTVNPREIAELLNSQTPTIVAGDLEHQTLTLESSLDSSAGRRTAAAPIDHHYDVAGPDEPTHFDHMGGCDVLDVVVYKGLPTPPAQEVLIDLPSDHRPVLLVLQDTPARVLAGQQSTPTGRLGGIHSAPPRRLPPACRLHRPKSVEEAANAHHPLPSAAYCPSSTRDMPATRQARSAPGPPYKL